MTEEIQNSLKFKSIFYPSTWSATECQRWDFCHQEKNQEVFLDLRNQLTTDPTQFIIRWLPERIAILKPSDNSQSPITTFSLINQQESENEPESETKIKDSQLSTIFQISLFVFNNQTLSWDFEKTIDYISMHPVEKKVTPELKSCYDIIISSLPILDENDWVELQTQVELKILDVLQMEGKSQTQWYNDNELRTEYQNQSLIEFLDLKFPSGLPVYTLQNLREYLQPYLRKNYEAKQNEKVDNVIKLLNRGTTIIRAYKNCLCRIKKLDNIYIFEWGSSSDNRINNFSISYKLEEIKLIILKSLPIVDIINTHSTQLKEFTALLYQKNAEISLIEKVIRILKYVNLGEEISFLLEDGRKVFVKLSPIQEVTEFPYFIEVRTVDRAPNNIATTVARHTQNYTKNEAILKLLRMIKQCPEYSESFEFFGE